MLPAHRRRTKRKSSEAATGSEEQEEVAEKTRKKGKTSLFAFSFILVSLRLPIPRAAPPPRALEMER